MYVASPDSRHIVVVLVHEVHHAKEHEVVVELSKDVIVSLKDDINE